MYLFPNISGIKIYSRLADRTEAFCLWIKIRPCQHSESFLVCFGNTGNIFSEDFEKCADCRLFYSGLMLIFNSISGLKVVNIGICILSTILSTIVYM